VTLIDQRILINAPAEGVWQFLADPDKLTQWHAGYTNVSILTTQSIGVGTRRRCSLSTGKDVIEEITAWVDGLGYEYVVVDGGPYRSYQGRIRLQASPDGTSVQWTIAYQPKGLLGTIRDYLGGKRETAAMMAASLRQLRRAVDSLGLQFDEDYRARVGIQARLTANERAQYQRRYPPPPEVEAALSANAVPPAATEVVPATAEPSFVADLTEDDVDESHTADTQPTPPPGLREAIAAQEAEPPAAAPPPPTAPPEHAQFMRPAPAEAATEPPPPAPEPVALPPELIAPPPEVIAEPPPPDPKPAQEPKRPTPPRGIPAVPPPEVIAEPPPPAPEVVAESKRPTPPRGIPAVPPPAVITEPPPPAPDVVEESRRPTPPRGISRDELKATELSPKPSLPPQTPVTDTGELSIWEVFGLKRPSEQDADVLNDLVQSVQAKKLAEQRRTGRFFKRPVRVRYTRAIMGLRIRLALVAIRVRIRR
jgi:ligand-binding SRPBCC domain-containing protein